MMKLGATTTDKITGFEGVITGHAEYISGCSQYLVQPRNDKDGKYVQSMWIDEDRLELSNAPIIELKVSTPGADRPAPRK